MQGGILWLTSPLATIFSCVPSWSFKFFQLKRSWLPVLPHVARSRSIASTADFRAKMDGIVPASTEIRCENIAVGYGRCRLSHPVLEKSFSSFDDFLRFYTARFGTYTVKAGWLGLSAMLRNRM